ncbi:hypothetical protein OG756_34110 [Streptomyces sp. NBC_01310]|uniref:hypothetical protein n=1 Tax=Streptomyces sp. NBC_01310 TaxID=2903820 RepID=UPI0035B5D900|nr:hypothetical protein OG756_34110 [Streptomyces sp. NBC_01310]
MKITSRILAVAAASGALLAATAPAHATDVLDVVNAKRIPVSVLSSGNTSADNIQVTNVEQEGVGSWIGADGVVREASRPYEEDAVEALLATLIGHDYEE